MISNGQKFSAEFIGKFFLVFIGTGAIAANIFSGGAVRLVGIAPLLGGALAATVYSELFLSKEINHEN